MPCYVDMKHLERAREALRFADRMIAAAALNLPDDAFLREARKEIAAALADISHADDDVKLPLPPYVPKATTITEAEAQTIKES